MAHYKKPKHIVETSKRKRPVEAGSFFGLNVSISFRKYDAGAPWATTNDGKPTTDDVFRALRSIEGLTWGSVIKVNWDGKGGASILQYHPEELSHHGDAYYKLSNGTYEKRRYDLNGRPIFE